MANNEQESGGDVVERVSRRVESSVAKLTDGCDAHAVFGPSHKVGDRTVLTAAVVQKAGGFGFGAGAGEGPEDATESGPPGGSGGGGGGGGNSEARPIAVIDISPEGVSVKPVLDVTKIGLAALSAFLAVWRLSRKKH